MLIMVFGICCLQYNSEHSDDSGLSLASLSLHMLSKTASSVSGMEQSQIKALFVGYPSHLDQKDFGFPIHGFLVNVFQLGSFPSVEVSAFLLHPALRSLFLTPRKPHSSIGVLEGVFAFRSAKFPTH